MVDGWKMADRIFSTILGMVFISLTVFCCTGFFMLENKGNEREQQKVLRSVAVFIGLESEVIVVETHAEFSIGIKGHRSPTYLVVLIEIRVTQERRAYLVSLAASPLPASGETWIVEPAVYFDHVYKPTLTFVRRV